MLPRKTSKFNHGVVFQIENMCRINYVEIRTSSVSSKGINLNTFWSTIFSDYFLNFSSILMYTNKIHLKFTKLWYEQNLTYFITFARLFCMLICLLGCAGLYLSLSSVHYIFPIRINHRISGNFFFYFPPLSTYPLNRL